MLSLEQAEEVIEHWKEEPPVGMLLRNYLGVAPPSEAASSDAPRELTAGEVDRIAAETRAFADKSGGPRNPFT